MKRDFIVPVTVTVYTKEEADAKVNLLLQMGGFLKDFNVQNLAGSFINHFMLVKLSEYTQGKMDLSGCYHQPSIIKDRLPKSSFAQGCGKNSRTK